MAMKVPIIFPEVGGQRFDCQQCGRCCRELVIYITEGDRKKIDKQDWQDKLDGPPYIRFGRSYVLNHRSSGDCIFLTDNHMCRIHAAFGATDKPLSCQLFPFSLEPEADGFRVSVRFDCPSVARSVGNPLAKHRPDVARLASALKAANLVELAPSMAPVEWTTGRAMTDDELNRLVERVDCWMRDDGRPIMQRLAGFDNLIGTLGAARLDAIRGEAFGELVEMLVDDLPNVADSFDPQAIERPTPRQLKLFRHTVFAYCENIRLEDACAGLFGRLSKRRDQFKRARRLASGKGAIPRLVQGLVGGTFDQLEQIRPDPELPADESAMLLTRYLRARITGRTAFGHGYYGWPVLGGLQSLLLAVAVASWLARYVALCDDRTTYSFEDMVQAIGIVDRNATRSPELGTRFAKMRLRYLTAGQGLLRLLCAYPIPQG